jgi:hypothetical protein
MSNAKNDKLVKIGMTKTSAQRRASSLHCTGTVGKLELAAVFCSMHPAVDERKVHHKLARFRYDKEYFRMLPADAISRVATILRREPFDLNDRLKRDYERLRYANKAMAAARFRRADTMTEEQLDLKL